MKNKSKSHWVATFCAAFLMQLGAWAQSPTAFTYQGRLTDGNGASSGVFEMTFGLHGTASGGSASASITNHSVMVTDGLFDVSLDYGQSEFTGAARWLEIGVRPSGSGAPFNILSPRQAITATPYAIHASSVSASGIVGSLTASQIPDLDTSRIVSGTLHASRFADGSIATSKLVDPDSIGPWALSAGNVYRSSGKVGIGTSIPVYPLHVDGTIRWGGTSRFTYSGVTSTGLFMENVGTNDATSIMRLQSSQSGNQSAYSQFFVDPKNGFSFFSLGAGNRKVGIGTKTPATELHVEGSGWFGEDVGALPSSAGQGVRVFFNDATASLKYGSIFAYNYTSNVANDLVLQQPGGKVGIGTTFPATRLHVEGGGWFGGGSLVGLPGSAGTGVRVIYDEANDVGRIWAWDYVSASAKDLILQFPGNHGAKVGIETLEPTHVLHVNGVARSTQSTWATTSDRRAKTNIAPVSNSLDRIAKLRPVTFEYNGEYRAGHAGHDGQFTGFVAQEVEAVFPDMVTTVEETVDGETIDDFRVLNTGNLTPHMVKAMQELRAEKDAEIKQLEERLVQLEKLVGQLTNQ